jgi:hypothetical protein
MLALEAARRLPSEDRSSSSRIISHDMFCQCCRYILHLRPLIRLFHTPQLTGDGPQEGTMLRIIVLQFILMYFLLIPHHQPTHYHPEFFPRLGALK